LYYSSKLLANAACSAALHTLHTIVIPKVSGFDILDNNIFYNLYVSETYILYEVWWVTCGHDVIV